VRGGTAHVGTHGRTNQLMPPHQDATTAGGSPSQLDAKSEKMPRLGEQTHQMALALTGAQLLWTLPPDGAPKEDDVPAEWRAYTGQTSEQMVQYGLREVLHPEDRRATLASIQRAVVRQQPYHLVTRLRRWDGVYQPFVMHGVPQRTATGHLRQWFGTLTNVTTYAEALLDQESTQRQVEPGTAVETPEASLSDANRHRDESMHIVAHELRTPLTSLKALLDVVERRLKPDTPAMGTEAAVEMSVSATVLPLVQQAGQQAVRLGRLLDDLTDAARAQTGKLEVHSEPCDLRSVVQSSVAEQRPATKRSIHLQMPKKPVEVAADAGRINQVLSNYITNAAKYSPKELPIDVSLSIEDGQARVAVVDRGQGIEPEAQARIWERFHQANSVQTGGTERGSAGLGLGLYISKHLIEHHDGAVGVVSVPGQGSTFWFTLPLAAEQALYFRTL
jgi:signal transduction histidine kinase